ncbi:hypothetical protein EDD17DRAFT_1512091 [Pisolithus thermaeus]|nr:hypothetical protein EV401DRAFT_1893289 [Pisolithus croceorrhizus]KAI6158511.1 hypothetical protein EDD17DRAFT_1512091 [Pisolithus thermaeus]
MEKESPSDRVVTDTVGTSSLRLANNEFSTVTQFRVVFLTNISVYLLMTYTPSPPPNYPVESPEFYPRTKRLLNTLIVYAVNWCWLTLLVGVAELVGTINKQASWAIGMNFIVGKREPSVSLFANSLLASLNTRQYLRSLATSTAPNSHFGAMHFANSPKLSGGVGGSVDGGRRFDPQEMAVINTTTEPTFDKNTRMRREAEV